MKDNTFSSSHIERSILQAYEAKETWTDSELSELVGSCISKDGDAKMRDIFFHAVEGDKVFLEDVVKYIKMSYFIDTLAFLKEKDAGLVTGLLSKCSRYDDSWVVLERVSMLRRHELFLHISSKNNIDEVERILMRWQHHNEKRQAAKEEQGEL